MTGGWLPGGLRAPASKSPLRPRTSATGRGGIGVHNEHMGFPPGLVTLLFTDVEGSIRLWEADREAMAEASARYDCIVREQVKVAGGRWSRRWARLSCSVRRPSAALAAAVAIQRAVGAELWPSGSPVRVRMALNSGACVERDGDYFGPVVGRVAGLLEVGHGGQVLLSGATYELLAGRLPGGIGSGSRRAPPEGPGPAERVLQVTGPGLAGGFGTLRSLDHPALRHNLPAQATSSWGGRRAGRAAVADIGRVAAGHDRRAGRDRQVPAGVAGGGRGVGWRGRRGVAGRAGAGGRT